VTAADSDNRSNEDNTKACLGFLVYLLAAPGSQQLPKNKIFIVTKIPPHHDKGEGYE
jgi:hypothetical protein